MSVYCLRIVILAARNIFAPKISFYAFGSSLNLPLFVWLSGNFKEEPKAKNSRQSITSKRSPEGDKKKWVQYIENQKQVLNEHQHFLDELSDFLLKIN